MEFEKTLKKIAKILKILKIPYLVTGGVAVVAWGRPRYTADIDVIVELGEDKVGQLVSILEKEGYIDEGAVNEALRNRGEFNFIDQEAGIKVDFWILKQDDFDQSRLKRRVAKKVLNQRIYFISPEDLILMKLLWHQQSQSTRQLEDIQSIMAILKDKLDFAYLKKWAKKLNTLGVLEEMISLVS